MKIVINENQMGLVFRNGKYIKTVGAGKYRAWGGKMIEVFDCGQIIDCRNCPLDILLEDGNFAAAVSAVDVNDRQLAFHFVNGSYAGVISEHGK